MWHLPQRLEWQLQAKGQGCWENQGQNGKEELFSPAPEKARPRGLLDSVFQDSRTKREEKNVRHATCLWEGCAPMKPNKEQRRQADIDLELKEEFHGSWCLALLFAKTAQQSKTN